MDHALQSEARRTTEVSLASQRWNMATPKTIAKLKELRKEAVLNAAVEPIDGSEQLFSVREAWEILFDHPSCITVMLNDKIQKNLGLVIGVNVSQEFPWKQVKYTQLVDYLFDEIPDGEKKQNMFVSFDQDDLVLMGYAPILTQHLTDIPEEDPFIMFSSKAGARYAGDFIKKIEEFERLALDRALYKYPGSWTTLNVEEDDSKADLQKCGDIEIEVQSVYPMKTSSNFQMRYSADVRDGYVELVPGDRKFDNIYKRRIDVSIQSSPALISIEQQTDPTFPTNAWTQYFYEVNDDDDQLDASSEDEEKKDNQPSRTATPVQPPIPKGPPELSEQVKGLLSTLEFNQIDMYRDDYAKLGVLKLGNFASTDIDEILCFANIEKSNLRFVSAVDWYPSIAGITVTSYCYSTLTTTNNVSDKIDEVQRAILNANPVLVWCFNDSLNFKLELEASREVTSISFCPYDENVLVGGTKSGQVILWDLQDRVINLDQEEVITQAQLRYREMVHSYLKWTIEIDEQILVMPVVISALDASQIGPITSIKWIDQYYYVSINGKIFKTANASNRCFMTSSLEGSVAFWNLNMTLDRKQVQSSGARRKLPAALVQNESQYKKLDRLYKPVFMITINQPISSILCTDASFNYQAYTDGVVTDFNVKFPIEVTRKKHVKMEPKLIAATFYGRIEVLSWDGMDSSGTDSVTKERAKIDNCYGRIHCGPILGLERNTFYPDLIASIDRYILAIWKVNFYMTPILWRRRTYEMTAIKWSLERPAVLYITRYDGSFEVWDFLSRDDNACLEEVIGGGIITVFTEHRPKIPKKFLGIGDYNSSFRMVALPENFQIPLPNELERLQQYFDKEEQRKSSFYEWQKDWLEANADVVAARKTSREQAEKELELVRVSSFEDGDKDTENAEKLGKDSEPKKTKGIEFTERMEKLWDEMNLKRCLKVLMDRKMVDAPKLERQTRLEKETLDYEKKKKIAYKASVVKLNEELANIRARLLPTVKEAVKRSDLIHESVKEIIKQSHSYKNIEKDSNEILNEIVDFKDIDYVTFVLRGRHRRELLCKSLGSNTARYHFYKNKKDNQNASFFDFGYHEFLEFLETLSFAESIYSEESAVKISELSKGEDGSTVEFIGDEQEEQEPEQDPQDQEEVI